MASDLRLRDERAKQIADVWKTVVGVQMHFNDIGMRIRGLFVTMLLALFASIGFLLDKKLSLSVSRVNIQFATVVPIFGVFVTMLFYFMDRYWFHRLLKGSVNHAIAIENKYREQLPELALSDQIGRESFFKPTGVIWLAAKIFVRHERFKEKGLLHSDGKLELFYKPMMVVLVLTSILLAALGGVSLNGKHDSERVISTPAVRPAAAAVTPSPLPSATQTALPVSSPQPALPTPPPSVTTPPASTKQK
ncbi:hypothetical protein [Bradyrhizobium sp. 1]|uniref:hypothetical protein n=1 Tax=Bradyrhizobium sp. 1 TaxID=241591 RepID=UPI001FFA9CD0|nr:hypothetical protein [Bradyrhizobium sp. 1]MCK1392810.1 hypothetical protein [Bradyrhizobium sp. 1]